MSTVWRILFGLAVMAIGIGITARPWVVQSWTGTIDWAEEKLGAGGANTFLKLLGIGTCFVGIFIATNIISDISEDIANIFVFKRG